METKYYYIHGLHGSKNSKKFLELQKKYTTIQCLDWTINDNIEKKIVEWERLIRENNVDYTCIIASSTGANFALQLRKKIKFFVHLVLINPLLNNYYLLDTSVIPEQLNKYLIQFEELRQSLILISEKDEVIDNIKFINSNNYVKNNNHIIIDHYNSHKFENLHSYYKDIDLLINNIYL